MALAPQAAEYDLLHRMSEFLDLHMIFPLMEHAQDLKSVYNSDDLARAKSELMEFTQLDPKSAEQKQALAKDLAELEAQAKPLLALSVDALAELRTNKRLTLATLQSAPHSVSAVALDAFFRLGKLQYEMGKYAESTATLGLYREITQGSSNAVSSDEVAERSFDALWGKLAGEIAQLVSSSSNGKKNDEVAVQALQDLRELSKLLEAKDSNPLRQVNNLEQLQFRRWMLHWSLFVFFHQENKVGLVDFMLGDAAALLRARNNQSSTSTGASSSSSGLSQGHLRNRNVLENHCPWLLRYVVAAHLVNKNRKSSTTKDLVQLVEQEAHFYSDPLCELFLVLSSQFDMERALVLVKRCEQVFYVDYFLSKWKVELMINIRALIMEMHCKLSTKVDVNQLCIKLGGSEEEAIQFVQDFCNRPKPSSSSNSAGAATAARLDAESHKLVMATNQAPVWQVCGDRIKDLLARSNNLESGILAMQNEGTM
ncbi:hypothetical protein BASA81_012346 [Batrachochytrium salamandrivorans]|nr:hypothetical protein BASA81_012346 [Batrachochytrium salamandrivorans]